MDDITLQQLEAALDASPTNEQLLLVVLRARLARGEADLAADRLTASPAELESREGRELAARILLEVGRPEAALERCDDSSPALSMLRARALLALGRTAEGRAAYDAAVVGNRTLEDPALRERLGASIREVAPGEDGRPRLRVISNDDTDTLDAERLIAPPQEVVRFADVGGLDEVKNEIRRRIVLPFQKPSLFERFRKRAGGGILLYGPPGCGKTLLARATAGECEAAFFDVSISDILDMYIGESERKLRALFEKARSSTPAVLFFDEIEGLAAKRQYGREGNSARLVSQFLTELDGFAQNNRGVLVMGASNVPWAIDPAFRRPGRFDRTLFVPPPDQPAREAILRLQLAGRPHGQLDLGAIAKACRGCSGADLAALVDSAADAAIEASLDRGEEVPIDSGHVRQALADLRPSATEWLTTARNYARYANEGGQYDEVLRFIERHGK